MTGAVTFVAAAILVASLAFGGSSVSASEQQELVDGATKTATNFAADPNFESFREYARDAQGMLIVPTMVKAGFIFGASGGSGVLSARGAKGETWSAPAFYAMGSVTFGLQIGGEVSEIILLVMTRKGLDSLLSSSMKLGADVSVAAGPVGQGAKVQTADILAYSRTKGLYGGLNVEGAVIDVNEEYNEAYYGKDAGPLDILVNGKHANAGADNLRKALAKIGAKKAEK